MDQNRVSKNWDPARPNEAQKAGRNSLDQELKKYEKPMADKVGTINTPNEAVTEKEEEHKVKPIDIPQTQRPF